MSDVIPNVLADRYATPEMTGLWSPQHAVLSMRELWIAGLRAMRELGIDIPLEAINAYERVKGIVNLESIADRELALKHDVLANIAELNALAGNIEYIHRGFTSRDVTDNCEAMLIRDSLLHVQERAVAVQTRLRNRILDCRNIDLCGRSHLVPAQTITLGKRLAMHAEEFLLAFNHLTGWIERYPMRGIKGPMGTQQDMLALLGSKGRVEQFEQLMAAHLGFESVLASPGQVYPRSLDFMTLSILLQLASGLANFANTVRLMAGFELMHEGFGPEQKGSSAMPHKVNSRTCERIWSLTNILRGEVMKAAGLVGNQWLEGDVSCSATRRDMLPNAFFAIDGIFESVMTVLDQMAVFETGIEAELAKYLPFLSTTALLSAATKQGMGREAAHSLIKRHALDAVASVRAGNPNNLAERLKRDPEYRVPAEEIDRLTMTKDHGLAPDQALVIAAQIALNLEIFPKAKDYTPRPLR